MKVHPETIHQTVRIIDQLPEKANNKPTVKAHTGDSQATMEAGAFSWRSALSELKGVLTSLPAVVDPHASEEEAL